MCPEAAGLRELMKKPGRERFLVFSCIFEGQLPRAYQGGTTQDSESREHEEEEAEELGFSVDGTSAADSPVFGWV